MTARFGLPSELELLFISRVGNAVPSWRVGEGGAKKRKKKELMLVLSLVAIDGLRRTRSIQS
jgi:hypothetical protein